jgi:ABC-type lipopolysaccharide export system ATPase subunit
VVTGHEVRPLLALADAVIWLSDGSSRVLGTPAQAVRDWHFSRGFLGSAPLL